MNKIQIMLWFFIPCLINAAEGGSSPASSEAPSSTSNYFSEEHVRAVIAALLSKVQDPSEREKDHLATDFFECVRSVVEKRFSDDAASVQKASGLPVTRGLIPTSMFTAVEDVESILPEDFKATIVSHVNTIVAQELSRVIGQHFSSQQVSQTEELTDLVEKEVTGQISNTNFASDFLHKACQDELITDALNAALKNEVGNCCAKGGFGSKLFGCVAGVVESSVAHMVGQIVAELATNILRTKISDPEIDEVEKLAFSIAKTTLSSTPGGVEAILGIDLQKIVHTEVLKHLSNGEVAAGVVKRALVDDLTRNQVVLLLKEAKKRQKTCLKCYKSKSRPSIHQVATSKLLLGSTTPVSVVQTRGLGSVIGAVSSVVSKVSETASALGLTQESGIANVLQSKVTLSKDVIDFVTKTTQNSVQEAIAASPAGQAGVQAEKNITNLVSEVVRDRLSKTEIASRVLQLALQDEQSIFELLKMLDNAKERKTCIHNCLKHMGHAVGYPAAVQQGHETAATHTILVSVAQESSASPLKEVVTHNSVVQSHGVILKGAESNV